MHTVYKQYKLPDGRYVCSVGYFLNDTEKVSELWTNIMFFDDEDEAFRFCNYLNGGNGLPFIFNQ